MGLPNREVGKIIEAQAMDKVRLVEIIIALRIGGNFDRATVATKDALREADDIIKDWR